MLTFANLSQIDLLTIYFFIASSVKSLHQRPQPDPEMISSPPTRRPCHILRVLCSFAGLVFAALLVVHTPSVQLVTDCGAVNGRVYCPDVYPALAVAREGVLRATWVIQRKTLRSLVRIADEIDALDVVWGDERTQRLVVRAGYKSCSRGIGQTLYGTPIGDSVRIGLSFDKQKLCAIEYGPALTATVLAGIDLKFSLDELEAGQSYRYANISRVTFIGQGYRADEVFLESIVLVDGNGCFDVVQQSNGTSPVPARHVLAGIRPPVTYASQAPTLSPVEFGESVKNLLDATVRCNGSCSEHGVCSSSTSSTDSNFVCVCNPGFLGRLCNEHFCDAALTNQTCSAAGDVDAVCTRATGLGYVCNCTNSYTSVGPSIWPFGPLGNQLAPLRNCSLSAQCASSPCQNGGTCSETPMGARCECVAPFLPPFCWGTDASATISATPSPWSSQSTTTSTTPSPTRSQTSSGSQSAAISTTASTSSSPTRSQTSSGSQTPTTSTTPSATRSQTSSGSQSAGISATASTSGSPTRSLTSSGSRAACPSHTPTPSSGVSTASSQAPIMAGPVCEDYTMAIVCPFGFIQIGRVMYGRQNPCDCPHVADTDTICAAANALDLVAPVCDGEITCNVQASNSFFGDPCYGTYKYLTVEYTCVILSPSQTPSQSGTRSATPSATRSKFRSETPSISKSMTAAQSQSPGQCASQTSSRSQSTSQLSTIAPSQTTSVSSTASPTSSQTKSVSTSVGVSVSSSGTASQTRSVSTSASQTTSVSSTASPTSSQTASRTASKSRTPSRTASRTASVSQSSSRTSSQTASRTASKSRTSSRTPSESTQGCGGECVVVYASSQRQRAASISTATGGGFTLVGEQGTNGMGILVVDVTDGGTMIGNTSIGSTETERPLGHVVLSTGEVLLVGEIGTSSGLVAKLTPVSGGQRSVEWANKYDLGGVTSTEFVVVLETVQAGATKYATFGRAAIGTAGKLDVVYARMSASGTAELSMCYGGSGTDIFESAIELSSGDFVVAGVSASYPTTGSLEAILMFSIASNGNIQWAKTLLGNRRADGVLALHEASGGGIFFSAISRTTVPGSRNGRKLLVGKLSSTQQLVWANTYTYAQQTNRLVRPRGLHQTADGSLVVGGEYGRNQNLDPFLLEITETGGVIGARAYNYPTSPFQRVSFASSSDSTFALSGDVVYGAGANREFIVWYAELSASSTTNTCSDSLAFSATNFNNAFTIHDPIIANSSPQTVSSAVAMTLNGAEIPDQVNICPPPP